MAEQTFNVNCGFFNSKNKDRTYSSEDMNRPYRRLVSNGIFANQDGTPSTDLQVKTANNGLNIIVKKGEAILADKWFESPSDLIITVTNNTGIVPRIDSIIAQVDNRNISDGRYGRIVYREGTPSSNPSVPPINQISGIKEFRLANIYVAGGTNFIGNDVITDLRGSVNCPWITALIQQPDTSTIYDHWNAAYQKYYDEETEAFAAFMESLTSQLTVNTNLAKYESHFVTSSDETTSIPINIANYNKSKDILIVRVNRLFASENTDYTITTDGKNITLTKPILANQTIDFLVLQSVVVGDTATVLQQLQALSEELAVIKNDTNWINFTLENGSTSFDTTTIPSCRKYGKQVFIRGAIKGLNTLNAAICTLPISMRPTQSHIYTTTAIINGSTSIQVVLEISSTDGTIKIIAKSGNIDINALLSIATTFIV